MVEKGNPLQEMSFGAILGTVQFVKRMRELEKENDRLKKVVADLSLGKAILNEALKENY